VYAPIVLWGSWLSSLQVEKLRQAWGAAHFQCLSLGPSSATVPGAHPGVEGERHTYLVQSSPA
jgi:hypothetical protein